MTIDVNHRYASEYVELGRFPGRVESKASTLDIRLWKGRVPLERAAVNSGVIRL